MNTNGRIKVADGVSELHAVNLGQLNARLGVDVLSGTGMPNGVVTAPVGTIYIDTAVTNGASSWIKKSGAGNTGWAVLEGDTGWRDITSLAPEGNIVGGSVRIRRDGSTVFIRNVNLQLSSDNGIILDNALAALGNGFFPPDNQSAVARVTTNGAIQYSFLIQRSSTVAGLLRQGSATNAYIGASWNTAEAWPIVLPGTPL